MKSLVIRTGILLISIFLVLIIFLSTVGIKTNKINNQIQNQIKKINKDFKIELKDISIILDPTNLKFRIEIRIRLCQNLKFRFWNNLDFLKIGNRQVTTVKKYKIGTSKSEIRLRIWHLGS